MEFSFIRYLESKRSVDDRALNKDVWRALKSQLQQGHSHRPLRILELGAGIGTMAQRMVDWGLLGEAQYTLLDQEEENVYEAQQRLGDNYAGLSLEFQRADVFSFLKENPDRTWDLILAHAFLDLLDVSKLLPMLVQHLAQDGLCYFTINYDGETVFEPLIDSQFDAHIQHLYNQSMEERMIDGGLSGDSQAGRHLFNQLPQAGLQILESGSSDWVVYPNAGEYPQDEAYFLLHILHFFENTLTGHPDLDPNDFANWLQVRKQQIEKGELIYIAHQLDFLASLKSA